MFEIGLFLGIVGEHAHLIVGIVRFLSFLLFLGSLLSLLCELLFVWAHLWLFLFLASFLRLDWGHWTRRTKWSNFIRSPLLHQHALFKGEEIVLSRRKATFIGILLILGHSLIIQIASIDCHWDGGIGVRHQTFREGLTGRQLDINHGLGCGRGSHISLSLWGLISRHIGVVHRHWGHHTWLLHHLRLHHLGLLWLGSVLEW